jgi:hypothetical protein
LKSPAPPVCPLQDIFVECPSAELGREAPCSPQGLPQSQRLSSKTPKAYHSNRHDSRGHHVRPAAGVTVVLTSRPFEGRAWVGRSESSFDPGGWKSDYEHCVLQSLGTMLCKRKAMRCLRALNPFGTGRGASAKRIPVRGRTELPCLRERKVVGVSKGEGRTTIFSAFPSRRATAFCLRAGHPARREMVWGEKDG